MGIKDFFRNVKYGIDGINDANKELVSGIKNDIKQTKTEVKDIIKDHNPEMGKSIEVSDRAVKSLKNVIDIQKQNPYIPQTRWLREKQQLFDIESISLADHLKVDRKTYTHHGLYIGNKQVLHYSSNHIVETIDLESFAESGSNISKVDSPITYDPDMVIDRGLSRLGESNYNLVLNNCEHFVNWCRSGGKWTDSI